MSDWAQGFVLGVTFILLGQLVGAAVVLAFFDGRRAPWERS